MIEWFKINSGYIHHNLSAYLKLVGVSTLISGGRESAFYNSIFNRNGDIITVAGSGVGDGYVQYWEKKFLPMIASQ